MKRMARFIMFAAVFGCGGLVFGQATNSGDITGTVTDISGAVVPGVTVSVLDVDKGVAHTFVTNDAGVYDTGSIVPDHYILTFTKAGFATFKRGPITVSVGLLGINAQMTVGQETQQVVVTTEAPLLETENPELSSTIASQTLTELPQVGTPDWQSWIALQPGASGTPQGTLGAGFGNEAANPGLQVAANGSLPYSSALMDGVTASSVMSDNVIATPIFDAIGEVKMIDGLFSAQYGLGGIIYNQITKGGTDHYHGMAYDYIQNNALNAAPYGFGVPQTVPVLHYNDIGGNIGGPIPIPRLRKRVFLFFADERIISHGGASPGFLTVPSGTCQNGTCTGMRGGDFTGFPTIYDPRTQTVDPSTGVVTRKSFASENADGKNAIESGFDPVALNIEAYYPTANTPATVVNGIPTNNYHYILPSISPQQKYFGRFDVDVTPKNRLSGSAVWNFSPLIIQTPIAPVGTVAIDIFNTSDQVSDVWTISNNLVNEFRMGFMEEHDLWDPLTAGKGYPTKLGIKFAKADIFPLIFVGTEYGLGTPGFGGSYVSNVLDPSDVVTLVKGRHVLHTGFEFLIDRADSTSLGNVVSANLGFSGVYTASTQGTSNTTGAAYADFLLGYAGSWSALNAPEYGARLKSPQFFVQDDFKMNSKLTLNLGLRWVGTTGFSEVHGDEMSFDPTVTNPATNAPGAMWYGTTHANGRTRLQAGVWNEGWLPRVGFAYLLGQKTTIRAGYGMFTFPWSCDDYCAASQQGAGFTGAAFAASGGESDSTGGASPVVQLSSDGNTNYQGSVGASINSLYKSPQDHPTPDAFNGQPVNYAQYKAPLARLQQWSLTVQRQLNQNMMASVGYVGSHGSKMLFFHDLNQVPESKLGPNDAKDRPYPEFQSISGNDGTAITNYDSLQAVITQRMSAGLQFNFNYTWSKMLSDQDSAGWYPAMGKQPYQNSYVPLANYGPSNFDVRQMFKGQAVYQLPFGKGRPFLKKGAALDEVVGGWLFSGTLVAQTGNPFTPTMANDASFSLAATASQYPNVVGNPKASGSSGTIHEWFNVSAFASPGAGKFGNMRRNSVYGPGLTEFNASLHKTFRIRESVSFDFFAEATNVINHPSFQQPDSLIGPGHIGQISAVTVGGRAMMLVGKLRF